MKDFLWRYFGLPQIQIPFFPRHRFTLIFDREGYSPELFSRLKTQRTAILTCHKHPGPDWNPGEFTPQTLTHPNGEKSTLQPAERGTRLTNGL